MEGNTIKVKKGGGKNQINVMAADLGLKKPKRKRKKGFLTSALQLGVFQGKKKKELNAHRRSWEEKPDPKWPYRSEIGSECGGGGGGEGGSFLYTQHQY